MRRITPGLMSLKEWLQASRMDIERRGLVAVVPLLEALVIATEKLREADWNDDASGNVPEKFNRSLQNTDRS